MNDLVLDEMLAALAQAKQRMRYLELVLQLPLLKNTRRGAEAQLLIFKAEIANIENMLEAECEKLNISAVLLQILKDNQSLKKLK